MLTKLKSRENNQRILYFRPTVTNDLQVAITSFLFFFYFIKLQSTNYNKRFSPNQCINQRLNHCKPKENKYVLLWPPTCLAGRNMFWPVVGRPGRSTSKCFVLPQGQCPSLYVVRVVFANRWTIWHQQLPGPRCQIQDLSTGPPILGSSSWQGGNSPPVILRFFRSNIPLLRIPRLVLSNNSEFRISRLVLSGP